MEGKNSNLVDAYSSSGLLTCSCGVSQVFGLGLAPGNSSSQHHFQPVAVWLDQSMSVVGRCLARLVVKTSDWPALNVTGRRFIQSPSTLIWKGLPLLDVFYGTFPRWMCETNPTDLCNISSGLLVFRYFLVKASSSLPSELLILVRGSILCFSAASSLAVMPDRLLLGGKCKMTKCFLPHCRHLQLGNTCCTWRTTAPRRVQHPPPIQSRCN